MIFIITHSARILYHVMEVFQKIGKIHSFHGTLYDYPCQNAISLFYELHKKQHFDLLKMQKFRKRFIFFKKDDDFL